MVNSSWALTWQKTLGGKGHDGWSDIRVAGDGGYILAGSTRSFGAGHYDGWAVKLDRAGELKWQKALGGNYHDRFNAAAPSGDGGCILVGKTKSFGAGSFDAWIVKLDEAGEFLWQKSLGGKSADEFTSIAKASDGYLIAGWTRSFDAATSDGWVVKIDEEANIKWQQRIGGGRVDQFTSVRATDDGGCILAGWTRSYGQGGSDGWAVKISEKGTIQWEKSFGGKKNDLFISVQITPDGGYLMVGTNSSAGTEGYNGWAVKLDSDGNLKWETLIGGDSLDRFSSSATLKDGGYLIAGSSKSIGSDYDGWLVNLDSSGHLVWQKGLSGQDNDYLNSILAADDGDYLIAGASKVGDSENGWLLKVSGDGQTPDCKVEESELSQASPLSMVNNNPSKEVRLDEDLLETEAVLVDTKADFVTLCSGTAVKVVHQEKPHEETPAISEKKTEPPASQKTESETAEKEEEPKAEALKTPESTVETPEEKEPAGPSASADEEPALPVPDQPVSLEKESTQVISERAPVTPVDDSAETKKAPLVREKRVVITRETVTSVKTPTPSPKKILHKTSVIRSRFQPKGADKYWQAILGGKRTDRFQAITSTSDGGFALAGYTSSFGEGKYDGWVTKLDNSGAVTWQKSLGGTGNDRFYAVSQTSDGSLILAGYTRSFGEGGDDGWVVKLSGQGKILWQKTFGGGGNDRFFSAQGMDDGGVALAGYTRSFGSFKSDGWILRLDRNGREIWQRIFQGKSSENVLSLKKTRDGNLLLAGYTKSSRKKIQAGWAAELKADGSLLWQKVVKAPASCSFSTGLPTFDGGYLLAGKTGSWGKGKDDGWVVKLDKSKKISWQVVIGGSFHDSITEVIQSGKNKYVFIGKRDPYGRSGNDGWVAKLNSNGKLLWQKSLGEFDNDALVGAIDIKGGILLAGYTESFDARKSDGWVIKIDNSGAIPNCANSKTRKLAVTVSNAVIKTKKLRMLRVSLPTNDSKGNQSTSSAVYQRVCP